MNIYPKKINKHKEKIQSENLKNWQKENLTKKENMKMMRKKTKLDLKKLEARWKNIQRTNQNQIEQKMS